MYTKCLSAIVMAMAVAAMTVPAGAVGLGAPEWIPGRNPQTTEIGDEPSTVGQAGKAIQAAVGMPQRIRDRLMNQDGGTVGQGGRSEGEETPFAFGLDIAAEMTQHAAQMGNRPEDPVPGLGIAATKIPQAAKDALTRVPIQWVAGQLGLLENDAAPADDE